MTAERVEAEIAGLHRFFEDWFNGTLPDTDEALPGSRLHWPRASTSLVPVVGSTRIEAWMPPCDPGLSRGLSQLSLPPAPARCL